MTLGRLISDRHDFPRAQVFVRRGGGGAPIYSVVFKNREPHSGFAQGIVVIAILGSTVLLFWLGISKPGLQEHTGEMLIAAGAVWVIGLGYLAWPNRVRRAIEVDLGNEQVRVLKNGKLKLSRRMSGRIPEFTIEPHPYVEWERTKTQGRRIGPLQKQHCLFGWFGARGGEKVMLVARLEWPSRESLYEIRQAILWAIDQRPTATADAPPGPVTAHRTGLQPPLD